MILSKTEIYPEIFKSENEKIQQYDRWINA